jgi:hypothetical protein
MRRHLLFPEGGVFLVGVGLPLALREELLLPFLLLLARAPAPSASRD